MQFPLCESTATLDNRVLWLGTQCYLCVWLRCVDGWILEVCGHQHQLQQIIGEDSRAGIACVVHECIEFFSEIVIDGFRSTCHSKYKHVHYR